MDHYSISGIKLFKACRRAYQLKYIEGLIPVATAESLKTGSTYHSKLEDLYKFGGFDISDMSKESAMATAYMKYIFPKFKVKLSEEWMSKGEIVGRVDAIAEDGTLVEHKTASGDIGEEYEYDLQWDEQILMYMYLSGARRMYYTICRKPTIRQKKDESDSEFFDRMCEWYDTDTDSKIRVLTVERTDEEIEEFKKGLEQIVSEIKTTTNFYRNPQHCRCWGRRCEYSSVCLHYDPNQEYVEFTKGE